MADAGQMLAQLWGNNPIDAYVKGAQISASLASLNQQIAATTFQNNLDSVRLADQQSQQKFTNQLQSAELNVHSQNAETERMFANQKLDPQAKALALQLQQARINKLNRGPIGTDPIPGAAGTGNPISSAPPVGGLTNGNPSVTPNDILPGRVPAGTPGAAPNSEYVASNQNPIAAGPPGITASTVGPNGEIVNTTPSAVAQVANDPQVQAQTADLQRSALQMAAQHEQEYGRPWDATLAIDPTSDTAPTDAEVQSAQGIKTLSDQLTPAQPPLRTGNPADQGAMIQESLNEQNSNPLNNPPGAQSIPAASQPKQTSAVIPAAGSVPPSGVVANANAVKPTNGIVSRLNPDGSGDGTAYKISQDSDGALVKQEFHSVVSKTINPATGRFAREWKPDGEAKPVKLAQTSQNWQPPATKQDGNLTLQLQGTTDGPNGVKTATYKAKKGDGEWTMTPLVAPGSDHVQAYGFTKPDGTFSLEEAPKPKPVKITTKAQDDELADLAKAAKPPTGFYFTASGKNADTDAALQKQQDLKNKLLDLQDGGYIIPRQYAPLIQGVAPGGGSASPASVPAGPGPKLPSALQQFAPVGK